MIFLTGPLSGKTQKEKISWEGTKTIYARENSPDKILTFKGASHIQAFNHLPAFFIRIKGKKVTDISLENIETSRLSGKENQHIPAGEIPQGRFKRSIYHRTDRGKTVSDIFILPIRKTGGGLEKITSFNYTTRSEPTYSAQGANARISAGHTDQSVLASGNFYKLAVSRGGIYKIDYQFLEKTGITPSQINPENIQLFGNGGGMLPQPNDAFRHDDLVENAIHVNSGNDGEFNQGDYILFYGAPPNDVIATGEPGTAFRHKKNIYSNKTYYFLTVGDSAGKRITSRPQASSPANTYQTFKDYLYREQRKHNFLQSGREWFDHKYDFQTQRNYSFNAEGLVADSSVHLTVEFMGASINQSSFTTSLNGNALGTENIASVPNSTYGRKGRLKTADYQVSGNLINDPTPINIEINYNKNGHPSAKGYLNFISLNITRRLRLYGNQTSFSVPSSTQNNVSGFRIANTSSNARIWDITNPLQPVSQSFTASGNDAEFSVNTDTIRKFVVFQGNNFSTPSLEGKIPNQNLHGISSAPEVLIVSHPKFLSPAKNLAQFKRTERDMSVEVATTREIYNEFGSGKPDITAIRDFTRMLYQRSSAQDSLKYLVLFGDASYNYHHTANYVPTYESRESLHNINSYASDDYYGFMDSNEGKWVEHDSGNHILDIGIGRLTVQTTSQAWNVVRKIKNYSDRPTFESWRNKVVFVADDGDNNLHHDDADQLATLVNNNYPDYNIRKLFLGSFEQRESPDGEFAPEMTRALKDHINNGSLVINYTGHGSTSLWAVEHILEKDQISEFNNKDNLPLIVTATCTFGRFDDHKTTSGAEKFVLKNGGGAIGLLTTTRAVWSSSNYEINKAFYNQVFTQKDTSYPRLGDVIRKTKNNGLSGVHNRNFSLLGDPSLQLNYPEKKVELTSFNAKAVDSSTQDTLKALDKIELEGDVNYLNQNGIGNFNGTLNLKVYDKKSDLQTIGKGNNSKFSYQYRNNIIFNGHVEVNNGSFNTVFPVPKDISYDFKKGKMYFYASDKNKKMDANGYYNQFVVGGTADSVEEDNTPPEVSMYLNDKSFVNGGNTNSNPLLIASLKDENGINISNRGVGHNIKLVVDGEREINLNEFYTADTNTYKSGKIRYPLEDLSPGKHQLELKVWDTHNNAAQSSLEFKVTKDKGINIDHVLNYPNPFTTHTTFHFDQNRPGDNLEILVQIYTVSGNLIKTLRRKVYNSKSHISAISWNGRDQYGDRIGRGVYIYKLKVRSLSTEKSVQKFQKLVILN